MSLYLLKKRLSLLSKTYDLLVKEKKGKCCITGVCRVWNYKLDVIIVKEIGKNSDPKSVSCLVF